VVAVKVRSLNANTTEVYVGRDTVTASGATGGDELSPGEWASYETSNVNKLYALAASGTQNVAVVVAYK
jgi:hypothetical protein